MYQDTSPAPVMLLAIVDGSEGGDGGVWGGGAGIVVAGVGGPVVAVLVGHRGHPGRVWEGILDQSSELPSERHSGRRMDGSHRPWLWVLRERERT